MKKELRILDLRDSPWVDGPGRTILDCAASIEGDQFHFVIGSFSGGEQNTNEYAEEARKRGLDVISIPETKAFDWNVIPFLSKVIEEKGIDLVHTHDFRSNVFGLICAKKRGVPVITTIHGWIANNVKGRVYTFIDKILLRFFDHIVAVSTPTKNVARKVFIPDKKITVVTNALKIDQYKIDRNNRSFREEISVSDDEILVANIGRLSPEKGQIEFLMAAKEVLKTQNNLKFILIGIGPDEGALREYVQKYSLEKHVVFTGFRKDMIGIYNSLDLVVQSSYTEGMPNVILEALLMSVPVIATDVGGTSDIVSHGKNGVLIPPGSTSAIEKAVLKFIDDREPYERMARDGSELIKQKFNHNKRVEKFEKIYREVAHK